MSYSQKNAVVTLQGDAPHVLRMEEVLQGVVAPDQAALQTTPPQSSNAPSTDAIQTSAGDVFTLAAGECGFIQNLGTNPLFFALETGASPTKTHGVLAAGAANDDGKGDSVWINDYIGIVSVAGTSPRFLAWKRAI